MESLTSDDGVGAIAISGAHFQKVKGKADHEPVLKQLGHHTVVDIDENRYVTLDTNLYASPRAEEFVFHDCFSILVLGDGIFCRLYSL